ncbi:MAG: inner membrane CreD family protein [Anaerolineae bacterium]|nr:inner membrane CreD family protein [Anaerolineae bacterium]MDW8068765.1 inner membrane CreD family protein [Anaerolineae bacterium]
MTVRRLVAIIFIFACTSIAWAILGGSIAARTYTGYDAMSRLVETLWGASHTQAAPAIQLAVPGQAPMIGELESSDIRVDFHLQHRRKGLLWYATYTVAFDAKYTFRNPLTSTVVATVTFQFPSSNAIYDDFVFRVRDVDARLVGDEWGTLYTRVVLAPGETADIRLAYRSRGLDEWRYDFGPGVTAVRNFSLIANTDFGGFNFPESTVSPTTKTPTPQGWQLEWKFSNLLSDFDIGIEMPRKINPGPMASRMSFFAPVSLLFFFTVLVVIGAVWGINLHPMHYFFLAAGFFAFHLLFAYLVDHVLLEWSFVIASLVSLALVVSYLARVVHWRFALWPAGGSQFIFLVLFSYAFFFEGYTGLVVTIGAIITLAVLMHATAKVDWVEVFREKPKEPKGVEAQQPGEEGK